MSLFPCHDFNLIIQSLKFPSQFRALRSDNPYCRRVNPAVQQNLHVPPFFLFALSGLLLPHPLSCHAPVCPLTLYLRLLRPPSSKYNLGIKATFVLSARYNSMAESVYCILVSLFRERLWLKGIHITLLLLVILTT